MRKKDDIDKRGWRILNFESNRIPGTLKRLGTS